jgi:ribosomal protein L31E
MAEIKKIKVEESKETKKLEDAPDTKGRAERRGKENENKEAIAKSKNKVAHADVPSEEGKEGNKKEESKPAIKKESKKEKKIESKIELEREYIVPLKRGVLNVPQYRRAKKAIRTLKEFMVKHMQVRDRDLKKVKIDMYLNNELWFRGIKKPANKIKVKAVKRDGVVYVELAEIPEAVKFVKTRAEKRSAVAEKTKVKAPKHEEKPKETDEEKAEEKEDVKAGAEKAAKVEKAAVKTQKHTAQGAHAKKSMPVRKSLKK